MRDILFQDLRRLFFGQEVHMLQNSLRLSRKQQRTLEERLRQAEYETALLRKQVNTLLEERQANLTRLERDEVVKQELERKLDAEKQRRYDAEGRAKHSQVTADNLKEILSKQV